VIAFVYLGLSAVVGLVVVITAAVAPKAPVVQQVAEPARQAVTTLVQPTGDMIRSVMPAPAPAAAPMTQVVVPGEETPAPFVGTATLYVSIEDAPPPPPRDVRIAQANPPVALEVPSDEAPADEQAEEPMTEDAPPSDEVVEAPAETQQSVQNATIEAPKSLPAPVPTLAPETPQQAKARADAANQAAIDEAKSAAAKAKADADAANQAAIDSLKATAPKR
jgi:hypothetical protein